MTSSPSYGSPVPGSFNLEFHRDRGSVPRISGAKSHVFQPPRTPTASASSLYLARSKMSLDTDRSNPLPSSRKRARADYSTETPVMMEQPAWDVGAQQDPGSPLPFVNTRYRLAGGMDTPNLAAARAHEVGVNEGDDYDVGYRRSLRAHNGDGKPSIFGQSNGYFPNQLRDRDANGRPRLLRNSNYTQEGWGRPFLQVVGGVVGKVWEFCKTSAFGGFHAGGGRGYNLEPPYGIEITEDEKNYWESEKQSYGIVDREGTPLPGHFPEEDYIPDYMDHATPESTTTPPRPAKRRQVSSNNDEIARNWVVVPPQPTTFTSTPSKPQLRGPARYSMPTSSSRARRTLPSSTQSSRPASRAGQRPIHQPRVSHAGSPALRSHQTASYASPRSPGGNSASRIPVRIPSPVQNGNPRPGTPGGAAQSPAAKEAKRWAAVKKREEREADKSIRRLDRQLKAMIREGKEALRSRVEVEVRNDDEGYDDSDDGGDFVGGGGRSVRKWVV